MMDARKDIFELMEIADQIVLFTGARIDRATVPAGLFIYDLRDGGCDGIPQTIEPEVFVDHFGTIICKKPISMEPLGYYPIEDIYDFIGEDMTLEEFMVSRPE